jgi:hypothetical protein
VAAHESGIYVVGNRPERGPLDGLAGVRKYDSDGNELWTREFSIPAPGIAQFVRAAADATGIYVVAYTRATSGSVSGQFVRKYSAAGDELWTRQLEFFPTGGSVGVDDTGLYVVGAQFYPDPGGFLRRYNAEGDELWTSRFQEPALNPYFGALAVDATGVYVLGRSVENDFTVVGEWDLNGDELWTHQLDTRNENLLAAAAAASGFYALGVAPSPFLRKHDAAGNKLWTRPVATSYALYPGGVAACHGRLHRRHDEPGGARLARAVQVRFWQRLLRA